MIKALIFDFDGLILDTEMPDYESWQSVYKHFGKQLPVEKWGQIVGGTGTSTFDPHSYLEELVGKSLDREEIWINRRKEYLESIAQQPILPGILNTLDFADSLGLKLAIASSSPENWVHGHLSRLEIIDRFHAIKTADDVGKTKPDPALFNAILEVFSMEPGEAIVFEDSPNGLLAAQSAGIVCVVVPNPLTAQLHFELADLTLASLADISLDKLLKKLETN